MMLIRCFLMVSAIFFSFVIVSPSRAEVAVSVGMNFGELDEYGEWVHIQGLGRVWRPDADAGWRPYMYGRWVYSDDGWLWDSDEPFGWIVCHYGNWYEDDDYGWVWVPGYEWSPARVEWYVTDNEIAWAPMFPPGHHHRFSRVQWMFCPTPFFSSGEIHSHLELRLRPEPSGIHVKVYVGAPRFEFVQRHVHTPVVRVTPRRVTVQREHPLVRIEIEGHRHSDAHVPIGPRFRKVRVQSQQEHHPQVIPSHTEESRSEARPVEHERPHVIVQPREDHKREHVTVQPREERDRPHVTVQPRSEEPRVRVEEKSHREDRDNNNNDNEDDNNQKRKRVRVEVH